MQQQEDQVGQWIRRVGTDRPAPDFAESVMLQLNEELAATPAEDDLAAAIQKLRPEQAPRYLTAEIMATIDPKVPTLRPVFAPWQRWLLAIVGIFIVGVVCWGVRSTAESSVATKTAPDLFVRLLFNIPPSVFWATASLAILLLLDLWFRLSNKRIRA